MLLIRNASSLGIGTLFRTFHSSSALASYVFNIFTDPSAKAVFAGADYVIVDPSDDTLLLPLSVREYKRQLNVAKSNDFNLAVVKSPGQPWNWSFLSERGWLGDKADRIQFYKTGKQPSFNSWYEASGLLREESKPEKSVSTPAEEESSKP
jgi:hypothetical protein